MDGPGCPMYSGKISTKISSFPYMQKNIMIIIVYICINKDQRAIYITIPHFKLISPILIKNRKKCHTISHLPTLDQLLSLPPMITCNMYRFVTCGKSGWRLFTSSLVSTCSGTMLWKDCNTWRASRSRSGPKCFSASSLCSFSDKESKKKIVVELQPARLKWR